VHFPRIVRSPNGIFYRHFFPFFPRVSPSTLYLSEFLPAVLLVLDPPHMLGLISPYRIVSCCFRVVATVSARISLARGFWIAVPVLLRRETVPFFSPVLVFQQRRFVTYQIVKAPPDYNLFMIPPSKTWWPPFVLIHPPLFFASQYLLCGPSPFPVTFFFGPGAFLFLDPNCVCLAVLAQQNDFFGLLFFTLEIWFLPAKWAAPFPSTTTVPRTFPALRTAHSRPLQHVFNFMPRYYFSTLFFDIQSFIVFQVEPPPVLF